MSCRGPTDRLGSSGETPRRLAPYAGRFAVGLATRSQRNGTSRNPKVTVHQGEGRTFAPMSTATQAFGELGERIAERWLRRRGWRVVNRRFRNGRRDIDLVVEREGTVAFVEVKARKGADFGDPVESVNWRKQRELTRSAQVWIDRHGRPHDSYRFDVVGVLLNGDRVLVRHVPSAFRINSSA
jgi:putative endonuclease